MKKWSIKNYVYIIIFLFTYLMSVSSLLYTESFILFIASFIIFMRFVPEKYGLVWYRKKTDFRWNELIKFYLVMKTWHRCMMRDTNIKIMNFLSLFLQIKKYEIEFIKKNIDKINNRDYIELKKTMLERLNILMMFKKIIKSNNSIAGLKRLPLTTEEIPNNKNIDLEIEKKNKKKEKNKKKKLWEIIITN
jgi:hypothetical protein